MPKSLRDHGAPWNQLAPWAGGISSQQDDVYLGLHNFNNLYLMNDFIVILYFTLKETGLLNYVVP